jgi:serine/threonine-protein kinase RsbW
MTSEKPVNLSIVVASDPSAIVGISRKILSTLKANKFSQEDIFAVHLALEEAFINSIRHGNKMDPTKEVKIDYSVTLDKIEISMTDQGNGFQPDSVPDPRFGENLYKTGGRGLFLIRSYMNEVKFNERGNGLRMVKYKGKSSLAEVQTPPQS